MKKMILLALLLAGCGAQNEASTNKDVTGSDNTVCTVVSTIKKGSGPLRFFKGANAECGAESGFAVVRAESPIQRGSTFLREQAVLLGVGQFKLFYNGVEVGSRAYIDMNWSELCTFRYKDTCDLQIDPIQLTLK